jgi:hypothetical protein
MILLNLRLSKLWKLERVEYANQVIKIVDEHDPEALKISDMYNLLVARQPEIDQLNVRYRAHPMTVSIQHLRSLRGLHISNILGRLKLVRKEKGDLDGDVRLVRTEIDRHFGNFRSSKNEAIKIQKVDKFNTAVEASQELEEALSELGFTSLMNDLRSVHSRIKSNSELRNKSIAARPQTKTNDLQKAVDDSIVNLFTDIRLAMLRNPEINYNPLIADLNKVTLIFDNYINIRMGQSERKAEEKAENENGELDNTTPVVESTEPAGRMMSLNAADMNGDGEKILPANEKKTIATTSNSMQLPLNDSEAKNDANTN